MKFNWEYFKGRLINSPNDVQIFKKEMISSSSGKANTALEAISNNVSCILVNKYLRILGTGNAICENISDFTDEFKKVFGDNKYIIAHDVFGGLFATEKTIHYYSPDTLQWEDLEMNYEGFIDWISNESIADFYEPFLWDGINDMLSNVKTDEGVYIYPFLWAKECDVNTAFKKIVPYKDLLVSNCQNMPLFADE